MRKLAGLLTAIDVDLDQLLLDPNNPRFADFDESAEPIPEARFAEERIQLRTFDKMKDFDVAELRDTIKTVGYLPLDRIVVRKWAGASDDNSKFVVVEGNRRVTALKWLIQLQQEGKENLDRDAIQNVSRIQALLLDSDRAPEAARLVLPGLRHVSGIKEWGPYQKARAVDELRRNGESPQEVAQSLGLSTRAANQLWRSYLAFEALRADEEFGDLIHPRKFSYFEELFKRANLRDWLGWDDGQRKFTNASRLREFYGWMLGEPAAASDGEDEERAPPKLPEAKSVRQLSEILDDESALAIFRSPSGSLTRALVRLESEQQLDWQAAVASAQMVLATLSPDLLRNMSEEDLHLLNTMKDRLIQVIADRDRLLEEH